MSIETILAAIEDAENEVDCGDTFAIEKLRQLRELVRKSWPRPMRLVFSERDAIGYRTCRICGRTYEFIHGASTGQYHGYVNNLDLVIGSEAEVVAAMQAHFDAAWQAMTEDGK